MNDRKRRAVEFLRELDGEWPRTFRDAQDLAALMASFATRELNWKELVTHGDSQTIQCH